MSLKYAFYITLVAAIMTISLTGILQLGLSRNGIVSINGQMSPNSLTIEKGDATSHPTLACLGCSGNGSGPG